MTVSTETFNAYSGNWEDSEAALLCKRTFLEAAVSIVKDYLGFDPSEKEYTDEELEGSLVRGIWLSAVNVREIICVEADGHELPPDEYRLSGDRLTTNRNSQSPFMQGYFTVTYTAGWADDEMPALIILSVLRIATLMLTEGNGNIGLTGKSFADNSRTFINYSNYRKYLQPLDGLRILRF